MFIMKFQGPYHSNIPFLFLKCYQKDVESLNHSDEYDRKNKEGHGIARTEWLKNSLRKNRIIVLVATIVSFITCIGLIVGIHYGSYGGINIRVSINTDICDYQTNLGFLSTVYILQHIVEMKFLLTINALKVVLPWHS